MSISLRRQEPISVLGRTRTCITTFVASRDDPFHYEDKTQSATGGTRTHIIQLR